MGLPTFQSVVTCVPNRYCLMSSGFVSASHTLDAGELIVIAALAMNPLFVILSLTSRHGPHHPKRLCARRHRVGQLGLGRLMRQVLPTGEEPDERPALLRHMVANRPAQHRIPGLQRVQDRAQRRRTLNLELNLSADARQRPQMMREHDSDHGSVWTSTDSTAGRSRTMGDQLSPESAEA